MLICAGSHSVTAAGSQLVGRVMEKIAATSLLGWRVASKAASKPDRGGYAHSCELLQIASYRGSISRPEIQQ
jgi:hypothetical protein